MKINKMLTLITISMAIVLTSGGVFAATTPTVPTDTIKLADWYGGGGGYYHPWHGHHGGWGHHGGEDYHPSGGGYGNPGYKGRVAGYCRAQCEDARHFRACFHHCLGEVGYGGGYGF